MKKIVLLFMLCTCAGGAAWGDSTNVNNLNKVPNLVKVYDAAPLDRAAASLPSRLTLGGYGEAAYTRNFYSDQWQRYSDAANYKDAPS
ncbi:MAG: amino acid transporter, partial [Tannerella sp.]|nr:amino acid transporter [Tannerella sp.]